jgi:hypothetical protein
MLRGDYIMKMSRAEYEMFEYLCGPSLDRMLLEDETYGDAGERFKREGNDELAEIYTAAENRYAELEREF